jgi:hypothetical protein
VERTLDRQLKLQVGDREPIPILDCSLERDMESSYLQGITHLNGEPVVLPVGERVTLWAGPSVVFVGQVREDQSVLDLLSCQAPSEGDYEEI